MSDTQGYYGQAGVTDANDEFNALRFLIKQLIAMVRTGIPVKVLAVHGGGVGPAPTVDVMPMVNQTDSQGNATPHGIIYGIPCMRNQGGGNAFINDPVVDDVGTMLVADRDISSLKANAGAQSNPGSGRRHNLSDGIYLGAILNAPAPTQYFHWVPGGGSKLLDSAGSTITTSGGSVALAAPKNVTHTAANKVALQSGQTTSQDQNLKDAIKARAQADLVANPSAKSVSMSTTLPSGASYSYTVSRN